MAEKIRKIELKDEEIKIMRDIMKFASENCPIATTSDEVEITEDKVKKVITKLENALKAK